MRPRRFLAFALAVLLPLAVWAEEQAFTNRATDLKALAAADSPTLAALGEDTPVKVLARGGGWTRVEAAGQSGWVRVFHLRFAPVVQTSAGGALSGLGSALGLGGPKTERVNLATTGIRGLSTEDVKNASPDPEQLRLMQSFRADAPSAERFARDAKLAEARIEVPGASGKGSPK